MSMKRLRSAGPLLTICKSSGENSTPHTWPSNSPMRSACRAPMRTILRRLPARLSETLTSWVPSRCSVVTPTRAQGWPQRMSSSSREVRWLRPRQHRWSASRMLVLPCALGPVNTVTPASGSMSACS